MCSMTSFDLPYEGDPAHSLMSGGVIIITWLISEFNSSHRNQSRDLKVECLYLG